MPLTPLPDRSHQKPKPLKGLRLRWQPKLNLTGLSLALFVGLVWVLQSPTALANNQIVLADAGAIVTPDQTVFQDQFEQRFEFLVTAKDDLFEVCEQENDQTRRLTCYRTLVRFLEDKRSFLVNQNMNRRCETRQYLARMLCQRMIQDQLADLTDWIDAAKQHAEEI